MTRKDDGSTGLSALSVREVKFGEELRCVGAIQSRGPKVLAVLLMRGGEGALGSEGMLVRRL